MADTRRSREAGGGEEESPSRVLVLFDGNCALCNRSVLFLLERDRRGTLRFAPLDSPTGREIVGPMRLPSGDPGSILVANGREILRESDAVLFLIRHLRFPWNLLGAARGVPRGIRDVVYRLVARNRLRWFGTSDGCSLMRPEWKDRLLREDASTVHVHDRNSPRSPGDVCKAASPSSPGTRHLSSLKGPVEPEGRTAGPKTT